MPSFPQKTVLSVALPVPLRQFFDYLPAENDTAPQAGQRVVVPFGRRKLVGVIVKISNQSVLPLEKLASVIEYPDGEQTVLTAESLALLKWCWRYYKHAPGEVVFNALPPLLRKVSGSIPPLPVQYSLSLAGEERLQQPVGRIKAQIRLLEYLGRGPATESQLREVSPSWKKCLAKLIEQQWVSCETQEPDRLNPTSGPVLLDEQQQAVEAISASLGSFHCHLLDGITGSGKTEVYLQVLEQVLAQGGQALLLVPEIGLTPPARQSLQRSVGF